MEIHLFILWSKSSYKKSNILSDISDKFVVLDIYNITWSKNRFSNNLSRFYGQNLPKNSHKEQHCGNETFTCIVVKDENPLYASRRTSKGTRVVNTNLFDSKKLYRTWTGGGHKIHATDNIDETKLQLMLLIRKSYDSYIHYHNSSLVTKDYKHDLIGFNGWKSLIEVFNVLNSTIKYVILRNFESVEDEINSLHPDIDLLTEDINSVAALLNAKKTSNKRYRVQYKVLIDNKDINFDLRYIGDNYYDVNWQKDILSERIKEEFYYRPTDSHYYFSLLYHALLHKPRFGADYERRLLRLKKCISKTTSLEPYILISESLKELGEFINSHNYHFTYPHDYSVYWNYKLYSKINSTWSLSHKIYRGYCSVRRFVGLTKKSVIGSLIKFIKSVFFFIRFQMLIIKNLKSLNINKIRIFKFNKWHDGFAYYSGILDKDFVFIKVSTRHFFLDNERVFYNLFKNDISLLKVIHLSEDDNMQILISEFAVCQELTQYNILNQPSRLLEIHHILKIINSKDCIHRDVRLNNFLLINNQVKIIDFTFSTCLNQSDRFHSLSINKEEDLIILQNLGSRFKPDIFEWNDFYSMDLVIDDILANDMDLEVRYKILEYKELFRKDIADNSYYLIT